MIAFNYPKYARLAQRFAGVSIALVVAACATPIPLEDTRPKIETRDGTAIIPGTGTQSSNSATTGNTNGALSTVTPVQVADPLKDGNSPLAKRSIYFEYDSFVLKDEYRSVVEAHAKYLNGNKVKKVVVQGNTDERGSREYNLALGQKRAEVVRKALMALGVTDGQIEAVSFGEEKPKSTSSDEAAFAENRRADLAYN